MATKEFTADKEKFFKVVASCTTPAHFASASAMYGAFCKKWDTVDRYSRSYIKDCWEMFGYLRGQWDAKKPVKN